MSIPLPFDAGESHVVHVTDMLAALYRSQPCGVEGAENNTPLDALLEKEDSVPQDHYAAGQEILTRFLGWVFAKGPDPRFVTQRIFVVARAVNPALLLNMTGEQISVIFGQGRAAESARLKMLAGLYVKAGMTHSTFRVQKSATARAKMAQSAKGNRNRKDGKRRPAKAA